MMFACSPDLPEIVDLDDYAPGTITRVYARGGEVIGEFATERRTIIGYDDIPEVLRSAIISAEDASFFEHSGFSFPAIIRTVIRDLMAGELAAGASTLTMQLARNITVGGGRLGLQKTWQRKVREAYYTFHLEKRYTKREIFTLYCNEMWLWTATHAANGVEAAAQLYFGKLAKELELGEAALIAGILQNPSRQSPLASMERATTQRRYALGRIVAEGYITQAEADEAAASEIVLAEQTPRRLSVAPYFVEEVRQHLEATYGASALYEDGLEMHTTLDARLQAAANAAVERQLRVLDKRHGYRAPSRNVVADGETAESYVHRRWRFGVAEGDVVQAVVTGIVGGAIQERVGRYTTSLTRDRFAWTKRRTAGELVSPGDLIEVRVLAIDESGGVLGTTLEQEPEVEAALLALDNRTGRILSMVGGYSFDRSKFNRATQAER